MNFYLVLGLLLIYVNPVWSQKSDKIDLQKIENQFWTAKDTDFSVVQNRAFPKENRFYFGYSTGTLINDPFTTAQISRFHAGYYFNERWGIELGQENFSSSDNKSTQFFKNQLSPIYPNYNQLISNQNIGLLFVPFYAKMSFLDRRILYFDMQFNVGVGQKKYSVFMQDGSPNQQSSFGYHFDITQNIFFNKHLALRVDIKNQWSNQIRQNSGTKTNLGSTLINDTMLLFGINFFI